MSIKNQDRWKTLLRGLQAKPYWSFSETLQRFALGVPELKCLIHDFQSMGLNVFIDDAGWGCHDAINLLDIDRLPCNSDHLHYFISIPFV